MREKNINAFLTFLAVKPTMAGATRNKALCLLLMAVHRQLDTNIAFAYYRACHE